MTDLAINKEKALAEEIKAILVEGVFASRWVILEMYWNIGKTIRTSSLEPTTQLLHSCAVETGIAERILWYALKAYDTYPDLSKIPEGKNITWSRLIHKYLSPTPDVQQPTQICTCPICGNLHNTGTTRLISEQNR